MPNDTKEEDDNILINQETVKINNLSCHLFAYKHPTGIKYFPVCPVVSQCRNWTCACLVPCNLQEAILYVFYHIKLDSTAVLVQKAGRKNSLQHMSPSQVTGHCCYLLSDGRHFELRVWICLCLLVFQYFLFTSKKVCLGLRQTETNG